MNADVVSGDTHSKICQNCLTCYINRLFNLLERKVVLQIKFVGCPKKYALKLKIILIATMNESLLLGFIILESRYAAQINRLKIKEYLL